ncbi:hypothetical protein DFJ58DRAFT_779659 [Suillus subalutaceus]|uniref:uncharacterized protein n=1 Tax=Suillus subalutaceus TaxID=48586 RepID=UPI001B881813|nr:uncharacterized protein DFJ58DRAFT_779659 [Suillus subalutaceus]KAG1860154.1 hypothetical protein DFJ58DRAFT_779659 [Suillus subalutaceus]
MSSPNVHTFYADAVLFDMDGTLTDSIAAVEAAWGKVAKDIGQDPAYVIAATHGKRAVDNLAQFKPHIKAHEMDDEVQNFENTILFFADAYNMHGPGSQPSSPVSSPSSAPSSRASSFVSPRRPSFASKLNSMLTMSVVPEASVYGQGPQFENSIMEEDQQDIKHVLEAWQQEATSVDRSVRILPGVKRMISSIPEGRYAVATSGAKTYAYGCMTRITITADDKRLKAGKPAPDPFLLAASELGFSAKNCVVFEDSPTVPTVIAVCTSHERRQIENSGAHFLVENMDKVKCESCADGRLKFTVQL